MKSSSVALASLVALVLSAGQGANQPRQTAETRAGAFTAQLQNRMQEVVEISLGTVPIDELIDRLSQELQAPVFFRDMPELTDVGVHASIVFETSGLPLGVELKKALRPHGLRAIVRDDALLITADTTELARQGIGTSRYINVDDAYMRELERKLDQPYAANFDQLPLKDAVRQLSSETEIQFQINSRFLENFGLRRDMPVTANLQDVTVYAFLDRMLSDYDLTLRPMNGFVMITTVEETGNPANLLSRAYWLDATGLPTEAAMKTFQRTIEPATWEALGGPSTMVGLAANEHGRPTLVISAPYSVHRDIHKLLDTIRQGVVDPDAVYKSPPDPKPMGWMGGGMEGM